MNKKQLRQYAAFVTQHAKRRRQIHGEQFNATEFYLGAACVFSYLQ